MKIEELQSELLENIRELPGDVGVYFKMLDNGEEVKHNENHQFWAASVIKVPIAVTFFKQISEGLHNLETITHIRQENMVKGSGVAHLLDPKIKYSYLDLVKLMLMVSDNAAANEITDLVGVEEVEHYMLHIGLENTTFRHKMMISAGRGPNLTTAKDITRLLELLYKNTLYGSKEVLEIMNEEKVRTGIPVLLPNSIRVPHKTGSLTDGFHDVGIVYAKRPFVFSFLSDNQENKRLTSRVLSQAAKLCFDYADF